MADVADVMDALVAMSFAAVYPAGPMTAGISGKIIHVGEGWPLTEDINAALAADQTIVSVYLRPGSSSKPHSVMNWETNVARAPVKGLTATVGDDTVSLTGNALKGEIATVLAEGKAYSHVAAAIESAEQVANELLRLILPDIDDVERTGGTLTFPTSYGLEARIGGQGLLGNKVHQQTQQFQITVWAPSAADRTAVGAPVELALSRPTKLQMPDGTWAIITKVDTTLSDREENRALYRRDMIYAVQFDTLDLIPATEITAVATTFRNGFTALRDNS